MFRCHILRQSSSSNDLIVFNFHHVAFDGASIEIFFRDLVTVYANDTPLTPCDFDYIDYSIHEKKMDMSEARAFWKQHLDGYSNTYLSLPYDHSLTHDRHRSGQGSTIMMKLSSDIVNHLLAFITHHNKTLHQVVLAAFYVFLFKLTQDTDLCVLTVSANRHRSELENLIGVFVNTLPHRLIIQPHINFLSLVENVKDFILTTLSHAHLPFQEIASNTNIAHVQTLFDVDDQLSDEIRLDSNTSLSPLESITTDPSCVAKFDLTCTLHHHHHHHHVEEHSMMIAFNASTDLFDKKTIELMASRFETLLHQLFISSMTKSICEYSILLPNELQLYNQLTHGDNLLPLTDLLPIHQRFACHVQEHPQKLAVILDDQSLTYGELYDLSQGLAEHLINEYKVRRGDIIGQCVERSIEMAIGMMSILLSGGSYVAFSSHEPDERLEMLIDLVQPRCILTHSMTENRVKQIGVSVNMSIVICSNGISSMTSVLSDVVMLDDVAFLMFTSGSTGISKVVPIKHQHFIRFDQVLSYAQQKFNDPNHMG